MTLQERLAQIRARAEECEIRTRKEDTLALLAVVEVLSKALEKIEYAPDVVIKARKALAKAAERLEGKNG